MKLKWNGTGQKIIDLLPGNLPPLNRGTVVLQPGEPGIVSDAEFKAMETSIGHDLAAGMIAVIPDDVTPRPGMVVTEPPAEPPAVAAEPPAEPSTGTAEPPAESPVDTAGTEPSASAAPAESPAEPPADAEPTA